VNDEMKRIVIASGNAGKVREIRKIFENADCEIIPQSELGVSFVVETGSTFTDNALMKARHAAEESGCAAIADDSGLVVDALDGRPGVFSARFAGADASDDDNIDKLLAELRGVPDGERGAHYECAAAWVSPDRAVAPVIVQGQWHGRILDERRGERGFGYDPVFLDERLMKTGAEMSVEEKNRQSHRGKAFRSLRNRLFK
jgi:XTP/dITP diphosphohydrolase